LRVKLMLPKKISKYTCSQFCAFLCVCRSSSGNNPHNSLCRNLHVVLCFSPVGDKFRIRARQFPALVNCTAYDWFHGWPHEALVSVANRFLVEIPDIDEDVRANIAAHMAFVHTEVTTASVQYREAVRRYCYTTPKSYLELISLYKTLLARKRENLQSAKDRLVSGVEKIAQVCTAHI
jgi:dynein heavy chain, axonemal